MLSREKQGKALGVSQTALLAYVSGVFWYLGNCYWIYQTMHTYGEIPKVASMGILLLFALYVALYHAVFGALIGFMRQKFTRNKVLWAVPFLWVGVELARARVTGFPWDLLGYTQVDHPGLTLLAPWTGVMGLSFVVALVNSVWLMEWPVRGKLSVMPGVVMGAALTLMLVLTGLVKRPDYAGANANAVLVQEDLSVGAQTGASETVQQLLASFSNLSVHPLFDASKNAALKPDLIAWPEAPADFFDIDPSFRTAMGSLAMSTHTPVVVNDLGVGAKLPNGRYEEYNSAAFFQPDGTYAGHYDKMRLVPFGEYVPYKPLFFFAGDLLGSLPFVPGTERKLFESEGRKYGVFICYESIFGDDIRHFAEAGAQVLVNISDDGWYGDSSAPWEHLDMVRMRAIENDRWIVRATNTGITAAIDPLGRVTATMPRHMRGSILVNFGYEDKVTFYSKYGDWFGWVCVFVAAAFLALGLTKRSKLETA